MNPDLYKRYLDASLDHHAALRDFDDHSGHYLLEEITREIIDSAASCEAHIRTYTDMRAVHIAHLINVSGAEERDCLINTWDELMRAAYAEYAPNFEHDDLRVKLLSMVRFMSRSKPINYIDAKLVEKYEILKYWRNWYDVTKRNWVVRNRVVK